MLWGRCWEGDEAPAFWPWIQIFRSMAVSLDRTDVVSTGQEPPNLVRFVSELEGFLGPDADALQHPPSDQARFRLFDRATTLLRMTAAGRSLVLILEDLHEADISSLRLLEFVAAQLDDLPLLVLATCREPEVDLSPTVRHILGAVVRRGHRIPLVGLAIEEVAEFLERGFAIVLSEERLAAIQQATAGNPFFLDELARRFLVEGHLRETPGGGLEVPEGLKGPIRRRMAPLPRKARAVLALASVMGREFSLDVLAAAGGIEREAVLAALSTLADARLVDPAGFGLGPHRFAHALVREIVYQDLSAEQRCRLHLRVAHAIETVHESDLDAHLDHLAHHFSQAAPLGGLDRAIDYARRAAKRAMRQLGYDEAVVNHRTALELAQAAEYGPTARFDLLLALGDAEWWAGRVLEASETFRSAAVLAREIDDPHPLAETALRVGEVGHGGAYAQAWSFDAVKADLLEEALKALGLEETPLKVRVAARLATALYFSPFDSLSRRESLSRLSVDLARRLGDADTLAYALNARHLAVWGPDNLEERLRLAAETVDLAREVGDVSLELTGRVWRLTDLFEAGDVQAADREIEAYAALANRTRYPQFLSYASMFRAMQAILRGQFADAEALAERSRALGEQVGDVNVRLSHHVQMALLRALQGRAHDTAAYLELVLHEHPPELRELVRLSFLCLAGDRPRTDEALSALGRAGDAIPPVFRLPLGNAMTLLAIHAGASHEAAALYDLLRPYERQWILAGRDAVAPGGPVAYPLGLLAASLARFDVAARHFDMAIDQAERVGARPYVALAKAAYGMMLAERASADPSRAADLLTEALTTAEKLGMKQLCEQVNEARYRLGVGSALGERTVNEPAEGGGDSSLFRLEGEYWTIGFEGIVVRMKDAKGLRYLRRLLAAPGHEFHVLELAAGPTAGPRRADGANEGLSVIGTDTDSVLDPKAKAAYRARIQELRRDLEEAEEDNDLERASRARAETNFVVDELARAVRLARRNARAASPAERARSAVSKSLRLSLKRIEEAHSTLGAHLATTVRTGYFCSYNPAAPLRWRT